MEKVEFNNQKISEQNLPSDEKSATFYPTKVIPQSSKLKIFLTIIFILLSIGIGGLIVVYREKLYFLIRSKADNRFSYQLTQPLQNTTSEDQGTISVLTQECVNQFYGYKVRYPITWFTTQRNEKERCHYFGTSVFSFPKDGSDPETQVRFRTFEFTDWFNEESMIASPSATQDILSVIDTTISSFSAKMVEAKIVDSKSGDEFLLVSYLVKNPKLPIIAQLKLTEQDNNKNELINEFEKMVKSLEFEL